ncbi:hypothetical protein C6Q28_26030 [Burkholderia multivorans]|jgi:hypothetical protein|uniref:Uncharacterized protein n=4 Tax=Burkholderia cepacia complex TaxID=87882 RepID=A0A0H3KV71_BURM1|nr:conserved hypothetical protein [Burkholderia multivorans ATCC 17616]AIO71373.1 hypothetical protein DM80_6218 [Burkholderia multivorans]AXK68201.1 hypothetical protein DCN14_37055 [Burkholderia sp. IDO3]OXI39415.1 hypothetical protein CFB84_27405 [Burkholderia aenigmatica]PRG05053.1 hypothetical protein C6Q17_26880 [Burkholderia contaminans]PRH44046.1 hypothetical protein C6T65_01705 [Burkholderia vietnamiensis]
MNQYHRIETELAHVRNATQVLDEGRGQFPPRLEVCEPRYWITRLHAIRDLTIHHNYGHLTVQANELLAKLEKLRR